MSNDALPEISYAIPTPPPRGTTLVLAGLMTGLAADLALLLALFIWHGGSIWAPVLNGWITIYWAQPLFLASLPLGAFSLFASGISLTRSGSRIRNIASTTAALLYWSGFAAVAFYRLL